MRTKERTTPPATDRKRGAGEIATGILARLGGKVSSPRSTTTIIPLVDCHGLSERGRRRKVNEDDFRLAALPVDPQLRLNDDPSGQHLAPTPGQSGFLFLVADGMGGLPCGERASAISVSSFYASLMKEPCLREQGRVKVRHAIRRGILLCRSNLRAEVARLPECANMGSTLTGLLSLGRGLTLIHAGDSRCYMLRGSTLSLLARDHTQAQLDVDTGLLDSNTARASPGGNSLWNCVSSSPVLLEPDLLSMRLEPGDLFLLCTDGVSDSLPRQNIRKLLDSRASAESICHRLVAGAREGVKGDDLTAVVARFGGPAT